MAQQRTVEELDKFKRDHPIITIPCFRESFLTASYTWAGVSIPWYFWKGKGYGTQAIALGSLGALLSSSIHWNICRKTYNEKKREYLLMTALLKEEQVRSDAMRRKLYEEYKEELEDIDKHIDPKWVRNKKE